MTIMKALRDLVGMKVVLNLGPFPSMFPSYNVFGL
jgi:hypothetical protein